MRTHKTEFPEVAINVKIPDGFVDESWINDTSPHFVNDKLGLDIWIDHQDDEQREISGGTRYALYHWREECCVQRLLCESDEWLDILRAIRNLDIEGYHQFVKDCSNPEDVVKVMDGFARRFYSLDVLTASYDEVALTLAEARELFIFAGEHWEKLMEKEVVDG